MAKMGTLKYRLVQNQNEHQPEAYKKWYIRAVQDRTLTFDDFVQHMADHNSPYSRGVIHGVAHRHARLSAGADPRRQVGAPG